MLRWSAPLVLVACTSFAEPDELASIEPAVPPPAAVQRIPDAAPALVRAPAEGIPADARIELERGACYGACPIYEVVLTADGVVRWHGDHYVEVHGDDEAMITTAAFAELWRRLNAEELAKLPDAYPEYPSPHCEEYRTDHPSAIVTLTATDVDARVFDYHGCRGNERLDAFRELEDRIDAVAGTSRWVGPCSKRPCRR